MRATLLHEAGGRCFGVRLRPLHRQPALHHVDPATKAFAVNIRYGRSLDAYREEAEKCVLLCANCHGEVEFGLRRSPPAGARYAL